MDKAIDILLNADQHLGVLVEQYGLWVYAILFLIVFCETGFVVMPFLPGDSLLFAVGALAAVEVLNIFVAVPLFIFASALGSNLNYWTGRWIGPRAFHFPKSMLFNPSHLQKAHGFYGKYGSAMMLFMRFVPVVRTFGPFAAGVAAMDYRKFLLYDSLGASSWGSTVTLLGFWIGGTVFGS
ncbi:MAG: VTT domain-containing protein [Verrucomicrobiales bacterium]|jgi:membrane-associated protein|nr:VTT domain-containing protein [Verrucomicrobiales bacterium]